MKCIYHNDMDGRCAGALVVHFTGNRNPEDYIEADYRHFPIDKICTGETVYIVDYSFTRHTVHQLDKLRHQMHCKIIWIDHHTSSIELSEDPTYSWVKTIEGVRNIKLSGAGLVYCYFMSTSLVPESLPRYIQYVDDYDRWIYRLGEDTTYFKLGLETISFNPLDPIWEELRQSNEKCDSIIAVGAIIKQYIDKSNAHYLESYGFQSTIAGLDCLVVNKRTNSWVFADKIDDFPIVATVVFDGEWFYYSLYSNDKSVDCSKIAESYGGGGHKGAAGFKTKELIFHRTK